MRREIECGGYEEGDGRRGIGQGRWEEGNTKKNIGGGSMDRGRMGLKERGRRREMGDVRNGIGTD